MQTKQKQRYKVHYRVGVPSRCQWREMFGNLDYEDAKKEAEGILRQGYHAIVHKDNGHGLPVTWEAGQSPEDYYERDGWLILKGGAYDREQEIRQALAEGREVTINGRQLGLWQDKLVLIIKMGRGRAYAHATSDDLLKATIN